MAHRLDWQNIWRNKRWLRIAWLVGFSTAAFAQTGYTGARFAVQVPAGWQAAKIPNQPDSVAITKGKAYVNMGVSPGQNPNGMSAHDMIANYQKSAAGQCRAFQELKRGDARVAGIAGAFLTFSCNDPQEGNVLLSAAVASSNGDVVFFDTGGPSAEYGAAKSAFDAMQNSFRLTSGATTPSAAQAGGGQLYRDPGGRFTVSVAAGWKAVPQGAGGAGGVQISQGSSWMVIGPIDGAAQPADVVNTLQAQFSAQYKNFTRTNGGPFDFNGRKAFGGTFQGVNPNGVPVFMAIVGVPGPAGSQFGIFSSIPQSDAAAINSVMQNILLSIRFQGE